MIRPEDVQSTGGDKFWLSQHTIADIKMVTHAAAVATLHLRSQLDPVSIPCTKEEFDELVKHIKKCLGR